MPGDWDYGSVRQEINNMKACGWGQVLLDMSNASLENIEEAIGWAGGMGYAAELQADGCTLAVINHEKGAQDA